VYGEVAGKSIVSQIINRSRHHQVINVALIVFRDTGLVSTRMVFRVVRPHFTVRTAKDAACLLQKGRDVSCVVGLHKR
jgi:hypothetical protein